LVIASRGSEAERRAKGVLENYLSADLDIQQTVRIIGGTHKFDSYVLV
jgi:hypothetical protein